MSTDPSCVSRMAAWSSDRRSSCCTVARASTRATSARDSDRCARIAQLVFVDLRGQGRSGRPSTHSCTLEQMAEDVAAVCTLLGIQAPVVFGHSAGGFVALHLAVRQPGLVSALILCDTAATLAPPPPDEAAPPSLAERTTAEAVEVAGKLFGGDDSPETFAAFGRLVAPFYAGPQHTHVPGQLLTLSGYVSDVAQHFLQMLASEYDLRPRLEDIEVPALVVVGHYDWICPPAASRVLAEGIADAQLIELPESGHFPFSEEPATFHQIVHKFVEGLH